MYQDVESIIAISNREAPGRLFVFDRAEPESLRDLIAAVLGIYSEATGRSMNTADTEWYPLSMKDALLETRQSEVRFGMPKLPYPASEHGKLMAKVILVLPPGVEAVMFYVDTNDDNAGSVPSESRIVAERFTDAIRVLADTAFAGASLPAPFGVVSDSSFNPANE